MADWVHCNKCFVKYRSNIKFYVTTCGHLTCERCASKSDGKNCLLCKSSCDFVTLNNDLKPEMQMFFRPQSEAIERTKQICMFQEFNKSALLKSVTHKYLFVKTELMKCYKALHDQKKENAKLKSFIKNLAGQNFGRTNNSGGLMFQSPTQSLSTTNFLNAQNLRRSTPFVQQSNPSYRTISNSNSIPHLMHLQPDSVNNSFALSFQTSLPDTTLGATPINRNQRPSAMMSISNLNLGVNNKPR